MSRLQHEGNSTSYASAVINTAVGSSDSARRLCCLFFFTATPWGRSYSKYCSVFLSFDKQRPKADRRRRRFNYIADKAVENAAKQASTAKHQRKQGEKTKIDQDPLLFYITRWTDGKSQSIPTSKQYIRKIGWSPCNIINYRQRRRKSPPRPPPE